MTNSSRKGGAFMKNAFIALTLVLSASGGIFESARADPACRPWEMAACHANQLIAQNMYMALPAIRTVPWRDLGQCEAASRAVSDLTATVGYPIASIIAGKCGECACLLAFQ
jgi:hypothetical protein